MPIWIVSELSAWEVALVMYLLSVFAIGPKVSSFKSGRGDAFLMVIKKHSTPSFGGELKLEAPCQKIPWHVRNHVQV